MKVEKQTNDFTILKRNDGRYAIKGKNKAYINGDEKAKILLDLGLIKISQPNPNKGAAEAAPTEETAAE